MTSILVVEDEAEVGAELAELLEDLGYRVLGVARTGEHALAMAGEARADVVRWT
jgi:1,2-diacylglycerol 3-beta-glucosyltransferase